MPKRYYFGNYPNSNDYDPNIPIGYNKWDADIDDDSDLCGDEEEIDYSPENVIEDETTPNQTTTGT